MTNNNSAERVFLSDSSVHGPSFELSIRDDQFQRHDHVNYISDSTPKEVRSKIYKALNSLSPHDDQCILVQFWAATKAGRAYILVTTDQPFGVYGFDDSGINVYRVGCLQHKLFVDHEKNASFGLVGLAFLKKTRQQTRDMNPFYPPDQRPKFEAEIFPLIWRNFAVPVFFDNKCQGVLEFVTTKSLSSYDADMDLVENALQIAGLQSLSEIDIPVEITSSVKKRRKTLKTEYNKYNDIASFFGLPKEEALKALNRKIKKSKKIKKSTFNSVLRTIGVTVWPCIPKKTSKASASAPETLVNLTSPDTTPKSEVGDEKNFWVDNVVPNWAGRGRRLPGGGSTARTDDYVTREHMTKAMRETKAAQERARQAEAAAKEQVAAAQAAVGIFRSNLQQFFTHYNTQGNPFPPSFPSVPIPGPFPPPGPYGFQASIFDPNNAFAGCYRPTFPNSITCPGTSSNYEMPPPDLNRYNSQNKPHLGQIDHVDNGLVPDQNDQHDTNERQPELANDLLQNQYDDVLVTDQHVLPNPVGPLNETTWDANARDTIVNPRSLECATRIVPAQNYQHDTNDRQLELDNNLLQNPYADVVVNDHHVMSDLVGQFYETPWDAGQDPSTCLDYSLVDFSNLDQLSGDFNDEEFFNDRLWS